MSEDSESFKVVEQKNAGAEINRFLFLMLGVVILGTIGTWFFLDAKFAFGFAIGGLFAFVNIFWLRSTLRRVFAKVADENGRKFLSLRFVLRYAAIGVFLLVVFKTQFAPVAAVLFGMASFAFVVLIEGAIQIVKFMLRREDS
jgi:hypothetical protein